MKRCVPIDRLGVGHQLRVHRLNEVGAAQMQEVLRIRLDQSLFELGQGEGGKFGSRWLFLPQRRDVDLVVVEPILRWTRGRQRSHGRSEGSQVEWLRRQKTVTGDFVAEPTSQSRTTLQPRGVGLLRQLSPVSNSGSCLRSVTFGKTLGTDEPAQDRHTITRRVSARPRTRVPCIPPPQDTWLTVEAAPACEPVLPPKYERGQFVAAVQLGGRFRREPGGFRKEVLCDHCGPIRPRMVARRRPEIGRPVLGRRW